MRTFKALHFFLLLLWCSVSFAEPTYMTCSGVTTGKSIKDSPHTFDIEASTSPPYLLGPIGIMLFCELGEDSPTPEMLGSCSATKKELKCTCTGGKIFISTTHVLSRLSGKLSIISTVKDDVYLGDYMCRKVTKQLF